MTLLFGLALLGLAMFGAVALLYCCAVLLCAARELARRVAGALR